MARFYDANLCFGVTNNVNEIPLLPCRDLASLEASLKRAGVSGGLVRAADSDFTGVAYGNNFLKETLKTATLDLYGVYTLLPSCTHEIPEPSDLPAVLREGNFAALRVAPAIHNYLAKPGVLADYYEMADSHNIPVIFDTACGITAGEIYDVMERFPSLTAIYAPSNEWPSDRFDRPFLSQFINLYMDLSFMLSDHGIEMFVAEYGARRFLFGSRFPSMYIGGAMLQLKQADIPEMAFEAIAGGNLLYLINRFHNGAENDERGWSDTES
ncbi:MAG: hypothetical protein FWF03_04780 [Defluviitaleaceae bacterium]|nr:hypothetical protein [Defluviitaleaceae bacterium]